MLITFKSKSTAHQKDNEIAFTAPVTISKWDQFTVYEFIEPSLGEQNRVEISEEQINIMAGPNTLNLALGERVANEYVVANKGPIFLETQLHNVNIEPQKINFAYALWQNDQEIATFDLTLSLHEK